MWVDLSAYLSQFEGNSDVEKEREMTKRMLNEGVYLANSETFYGEYSGWFRITFAVEKDMLELGLIR